MLSTDGTGAGQAAGRPARQDQAAGQAAGQAGFQAGGPAAGWGAVAASWPAEAASVPAARRLVRQHLQRCGQQDLSESAELLVSELATNVVLHVGGSLQVQVLAGTDEVLVEVGDLSPVVPQLRTFSQTSSTGRGMRLLQSLSSEHGVRLRPGGGGKAVWARITLESVRREEDELALEFAEGDWLAELSAPAQAPGVRAAAPAEDRAPGAVRAPRAA